MGVIVFLLECLASLCIILVIIKILQKFLEDYDDPKEK